MTTYYSFVPSPLGDLLLTGDGVALTRLYMTDQKYADSVDPAWKRDDRLFKSATAQLDAYFAGTLAQFDLTLAPQGTEFQQSVWKALLDIPFGQTESYGSLATRLGKPGASRAVGLANGRNPISIIIPCHRVIGANGSLTGYGGGIDRKRWLLRHERALPVDESASPQPGQQRQLL